MRSSSRAFRALPWGVLLTGGLAAGLVTVFTEQSRARTLAQGDRATAETLARVVSGRLEAQARAVSAPLAAFDLADLGPDELVGAVRLAFVQNDAVTAVTLLDQAGVAVVPAVYNPRGHGLTDGESVEDLAIFARHIPLAQSLAHGGAWRGPYAGSRRAARVAVAESISAAGGTQIRVAAAEVDAASFVAGLGPREGGVVVLAAPGATVGAWEGMPAEARARVLSAAGHPPRSATAIAGDAWHGAVVPLDGMDGVLAVIASEEPADERAARRRDGALAVLVFTVVAAAAAALRVALRDLAMVTDGGYDERVGEARVLGAVVRELANPVAAAAAAARLLGSNADPRVIEAVQRSTQRTERAFRRVARLARAGEERALEPVDIAAAARTEVEALEPEVARGGHILVAKVSSERCEVLGTREDVAMLLQALADGARAIAPARSEIELRIGNDGNEVEVAVTDTGRLSPDERLGFARLAAAVKDEGAASALAWATAARVAADLRGVLLVRETDGKVTVAVRLPKVTR